MQDKKSNLAKISLLGVLVIVVGYFAFNNFTKTNTQVATPIEQVKKQVASRKWENKLNLYPNGLQAEVLQVDLSYTASGNVFSVDSMSRFQTYKQKKAKKVESISADFRIALLDASKKVLTETTVPNTWSGHEENISSSGEFSSKTFNSPTAKTSASLPYDASATEIRISDSKGKVLLTSPVSAVAVMPLEGDFSGINGQDFLNPTSEVSSISKFFKVAEAGKPSGAGGGSGGSGGGSGGGGGTPPPPPTPTYDIAFISSGYTTGEMLLFHDARDAAVARLLAVQPYAARASQINFYSVDNTKTLKCGDQYGYFYCDQTLAYKYVSAAGIAADAVVVLHKNPVAGFSGRGCCGMAVLRVDHSVSASTLATSLGRSFTHEMGHVVGNLLDEYQNSNTGTTVVDNVVYKNCLRGAVPPYPSEWSGLVGTADYYPLCGLTTWTTPGRSVMGDLMSSWRYNIPSQMLVKAGLDAYTGGFTDTTNPTVSVTSPLDGGSVYGNATVDVSASDNAGVSRVKLFVDNVYKYTSHFPGPYTFVIPLGTGVHTLRAEAVDTNGNVATTPTVSITQTMPNAPNEFDTTGPVITNIVTTSVTSTSAVVTWTTDEPSNSVVFYRIGQIPQTEVLTASVSGLVTSHSVPLTSLVPNSPYYFRVSSIDASNNQSMSSTQYATDSFFNTLP